MAENCVEQNVIGPCYLVTGVDNGSDPLITTGVDKESDPLVTAGVDKGSDPLVTAGMGKKMEDDISFVQPTPKLKRSRTLLKRISSTTSFDVTMFKSPLRRSTRKRKRKDVDDDSMSVQSLNIVPEHEHATTEKKSKRRSLVKMFSPSTTKRSFSFKSHGSAPSGGGQTPHRQISPYKKPKPACVDRRASSLWCETVDEVARSAISNREKQRQEAIHELLLGEEAVIEDLTNVDKHYYQPMKQLKLMTEEELDSIFGIVRRLVPFHEDLLSCLKAMRKSDGTIGSIGDVFLQWLPNLKHYETYCANQVFAKGLLDQKKSDKKVDDFLTRCLESKFSRKLELWNFLDLPRSRLVKYPILLKQVHKYTEDSHPDKEAIVKVLDMVDAVIKEVDVKMGESLCKHTISLLHFLYDSQRCELINESTAILCSGQLKNDRGTKLHVVLFDKVLVVTRMATRNNVMGYQVVKEPIPLADLNLTDLAETEGKKGSFKNIIRIGSSLEKSAFRVATASGQAHTLFARDEHDKRQWLTCLRNAVNKASDDSCEANITPCNKSQETVV